MAKPLQFEFDNSEVEFEMIKVDRSKLYGFKELEVLDDDGNPCELTTLADDGRTIVGKGGTGIGYLDADGNWCEKSQLRPVDLEGNEITPVPSSFSAAIELKEEISIDDYLAHNIRLIYQLQPLKGADALTTRLKAGAIFRFPYSYRGGLESDAGFLLSNAEDEIFFLVGDPTNLDYKGLQSTPTVEETDTDDASEESDDLMDFDMI